MVRRKKTQKKKAERILKTTIVNRTSKEAKAIAEKVLKETEKEAFGPPAHTGYLTADALKIMKQKPKKKVEPDSVKTLRRINMLIGRKGHEAAEAELKAYLNSGMPLLLVMFKENIINETMKEKIDGPATERLNIINRKLKEAGYEEKLKEAKEKLGMLVVRGDDVTKSNALRAAGDLGIKEVVRTASMDRDPLLRREAGIIAVRKGMKEIMKEMIENPKEKNSIKQAMGKEMDILQGKIDKKPKKITREWIN